MSQLLATDHIGKSEGVELKVTCQDPSTVLALRTTSAEPFSIPYQDDGAHSRNPSVPLVGGAAPEGFSGGVRQFLPSYFTHMTEARFGALSGSRVPFSITPAASEGAITHGQDLDLPNPKALQLGVGEGSDDVLTELKILQVDGTNEVETVSDDSGADQSSTSSEADAPSTSDDEADVDSEEEVESDNEGKLPTEEPTDDGLPRGHNQPQPLTGMKLFLHRYFGITEADVRRVPVKAFHQTTVTTKTVSLQNQVNTQQSAATSDGPTIGGRKKPKFTRELVVAAMDCDRHCILATEDDRFYHRLVTVQVSRMAGSWASTSDAPLPPGDALTKSETGTSIEVGRGSKKGNSAWGIVAEVGKSRAPNCRLVSVHAGAPVSISGSGSGGPAVLRFILSTTKIQKGEVLWVSGTSIDRSLGHSPQGCPSTPPLLSPEAAFYGQQYKTEVARSPEILHGAEISCWPSHLHYYYGVGERHRWKQDSSASANSSTAASKPVVAFPDSLLQLQPCPELSDETRLQYEVVARADIPYGTCFIYGGKEIKSTSSTNPKKEGAEATSLPVSTSKVPEVVGSRKRPRADGDQVATKEEHPDEKQPRSGEVEADGDEWSAAGQYVLTLNKSTAVDGRSITRFINHYYNFAKFGNVQFICVTLVVGSPDTDETGGKKTKGKSKKKKSATNLSGPPVSGIPHSSTVKLTENSGGQVKVVACLMTVRDIYRGEKVLACSYGAEFDAVLEREVLSSGYVVTAHDLRLWRAAKIPQQPPAIDERNPKSGSASGVGRVLSQQPLPLEVLSMDRDLSARPIPHDLLCKILSPLYRADYTGAIQRGSIVWLPPHASDASSPISPGTLASYRSLVHSPLQIYVVVDIEFPLMLCAPLALTVDGSWSLPDQSLGLERLKLGSSSATGGGGGSKLPKAGNPRVHTNSIAEGVLEWLTHFHATVRRWRLEEDAAKKNETHTEAVDRGGAKTSSIASSMKRRRELLKVEAILVASATSPDFNGVKGKDLLTLLPRMERELFNTESFLSLLVPDASIVASVSQVGLLLENIDWTVCNPTTRSGLEQIGQLPGKAGKSKVPQCIRLEDDLRNRLLCFFPVSGDLDGISGGGGPSGPGSSGTPLTVSAGWHWFSLVREVSRVLLVKWLQQQLTIGE